MKKYLDKPCTRCKALEVIPPLKAELGKSIILVRCDRCGKCSRYNIVATINGDKYYLSKWGRGSGGDLVMVKRWIRRDQTWATSSIIRDAIDKVK